MEREEIYQELIYRNLKVDNDGRYRVPATFDDYLKSLPNNKQSQIWWNLQFEHGVIESPILECIILLGIVISQIFLLINGDWTKYSFILVEALFIYMRALNCQVMGKTAKDFYCKFRVVLEFLIILCQLGVIVADFYLKSVNWVRIGYLVGLCRFYTYTPLGSGLLWQYTSSPTLSKSLSSITQILLFFLLSLHMPSMADSEGALSGPYPHLLLLLFLSLLLGVFSSPSLPPSSSSLKASFTLAKRRVLNGKMALKEKVRGETINRELARYIFREEERVREAWGGVEERTREKNEKGDRQSNNLRRWGRKNKERYVNPKLYWEVFTGFQDINKKLLEVADEQQQKQKKEEQLKIAKTLFNHSFRDARRRKFISIKSHSLDTPNPLLHILNTSLGKTRATKFMISQIMSNLPISKLEDLVNVELELSNFI